MISSNFIFNLPNFCVIVSFFIVSLLLTLAVLFSTAVRGVVVAELVILSILPLTTFTLSLRVVLVA